VATSGLYNYNRNRDQLIDAAARKMGISTFNEPLSAEDNAIACEALNVLIKSWQAKDLFLWKYQDVIVFPQYGQATYNLGSTSTDHYTTNYSRTILTAASGASDTTINVQSATGFGATYYVGVELDNGYMFWTTQSGAAAGLVVTLTTGLYSAASAGNAVFVYQAKAARPQKVHYATLLQNWQLSSADAPNNSSETPLTVLATKDYFMMPNKASLGQVVQISYDPLLTNGKLSCYQTPNDVTSPIILQTTYPFEYFTTTTDEPDAPNEWLKALIYNLAWDLCDEFGINGERAASIKEKAQYYLQELLDYDQEMDSIYIQPA
jgi:hypothetical protein